jgi:hypothetical protein
MTFVCGKGERAAAKSEIQGSLHCGGKSAAFGRDDVVYGQERKQSKAEAKYRGSLHCAPDDKTVRRFGRDDVDLWGQKRCFRLR